jgi:hypothetical protein
VKLKIAVLVLLAIATTSAFPKSSHGVRGYTKKDGTRVQPHRATNPDKSKANNYSSKGNTNPNTGKEGTKDPNAPKKKP